METFFPDWHRSRLESVAARHADEISFERGGMGCECGDIDRLVVNLLRHEFTSYDDDQSAQAHRAACLAIKARFPWLADECERQIARRASDDAWFHSMLDAYEAEERARKLWRQERSARSAEVIGSLSIGLSVGVKIKGHHRAGVITWLGRSRVEVAYSIKSGAERRAKVYASEVSSPLQPAEGAT